MTEIEDFLARNRQNVSSAASDKGFRELTKKWLEKANSYEYSYHFTWLSRPIIQYPQDIVAVQELIWEIKPDLIIETGIAHGGSLILSASMLALLDYCDSVQTGAPLDPMASRRRVVGIDIDIRSHNKNAIVAHPMAHMIEMIEGSSIAPETIEKVRGISSRYNRALVMLDSNHTHEHVLSELKAYAPLTSRGSYCVVFDTIIEELPEGQFPHRAWDRGDNPKTAVLEFLNDLNEHGGRGSDGNTLQFEVDKTIENKLMISVAPGGFLRRT